MSVERLFAEQFERCGVLANEPAVVLSESASRPELVDAARRALTALGAMVAEVVMPTPAQTGPVPVRSTGASTALAGHPAAIAALSHAWFVVDCTVEGLLHAPELGTILQAGARVLMISNEHPEVFERLGHDPELGVLVAQHLDRLMAATTMTVSSAAGTELTVDLAGSFRAGSDGLVRGPGQIAHWPGGLVLAFPSAGTVNGRVVLAPGDVNLTFKEYVRSPVELTVIDDRVVEIAGDGLDAELFRSYLAAWNESDAYAVSHVGWGLNARCRWDVLPLYDKSQINGTELRAFAGNFLFSTGANETAGRFCRGHFDLPMRNCTIALDGTPIVDTGSLVIL